MKVHYVQEDHHMDWYEEQLLQPGHYLLSLCTYGNCVYWVNGQKYIMEKGELLLVPPQCSYYGKSVPTRVHTKQTIGFAVQETWSSRNNGMMSDGSNGFNKPDNLNNSNNPNNQNDSKDPNDPNDPNNEPATPLSLLRQQQPVHMKPGCYERIHDMLKQLAVQWEERPSYYELMAESLLTQLLVELNREYDRGIISEDRHRLVEQMKRYIQQNYSLRIGKEQLAEVIQRTPNYAATLFKTITGQTISEYTHQERMKRAVYMLTESHLTVAEIAEFLGYSEVSYFYRIFKKTMGVPPTGLMQDRPPLL